MTEFVEQCRREWKRLGVAESLAEEMAADLTADLEAAQAEGVSVEEYLGASASDPQSFAASWAAERGVIPASAEGDNDGRRPRALVAFTFLAAVVLIAAALLLATGEPQVALTASRTAPPHFPSSAHPSLPPGVGPGHRVQAAAAAPVEWILMVVALAALVFSAWLWRRWNQSRDSAAPPGGLLQS